MKQTKTALWVWHRQMRQCGQTRTTLSVLANDPGKSPGLGARPLLSLAAQTQGKFHWGFFEGQAIPSRTAPAGLGTASSSGILRLLSGTRVPRWPRHQKIVTLPWLPSRDAAKTPRNPRAAALPVPSRRSQPWDGDGSHLPSLNHPRASRSPENPVCQGRDRGVTAEGMSLQRGCPCRTGCSCRAGCPAERVSRRGGARGRAGRQGRAVRIPRERAASLPRIAPPRGRGGCEGTWPVPHRPDSSCRPRERCKHAPSLGRMISASSPGLSLARVCGCREGPAGGGRAAPASRGSERMRFPTS